MAPQQKCVQPQTLGVGQKLKTLTIWRPSKSKSVCVHTIVYIRKSIKPLLKYFSEYMGRWQEQTRSVGAGRREGYTIFVMERAVCIGDVWMLMAFVLDYMHSLWIMKAIMEGVNEFDGHNIHMLQNCVRSQHPHGGLRSRIVIRPYHPFMWMGDLTHSNFCNRSRPFCIQHVILGMRHVRSHSREH